MASADALKKRKVLSAHGVAKHERANARGIRPKRQRHDVQHQAHMFGVVHASTIAQPRPIFVVVVDTPAEAVDFLARQRIAIVLGRTPIGIELDAALHRADRFEILVELFLVLHADARAQAFGVV